MEVVPSEEELKRQGLLPDDIEDIHAKRVERAYQSMYNNALKDAGATHEEYRGFNTLVFLVFVGPTLLGILIGGFANMDMAHSFLMVWVHEAGHGFWCMVGTRVFCAFMGLGNELLFCVVPAVICMRDKRMYYAAGIFLMWAGLSLSYAGDYMATAQEPIGTSFAGMLTGRRNDMSVTNHDWSIVFRGLGIISWTPQISFATKTVGLVLAISFAASALIFFFPTWGGYEPKNFSDIMGPGALAACAFFIVHGDPMAQVILAFIFGIPAIGVINAFLQKKPIKTDERSRTRGHSSHARGGRHRR